eukprot:5329106-Amphidinium_carterae.1
MSGTKRCDIVPVLVFIFERRRGYTSSLERMANCLPNMSQGCWSGGTDRMNHGYSTLSLKAGLVDEKEI